MSQSRCEAIRDRGDVEARLYASDSGRTYLTSVPLSWFHCGPDGLGIEFVGWYGPILLDEDRNDEDELIATVRLFDPTRNGGRWLEFDSGVWKGEFARGTAGDGRR
ncbi:hypothetical protein [Actinoplanes sp. G11-F43]|uniref:hypothetical protein n=1 Tax=Actinoplanes sp. G11-F43 TaxID=3424130 RepID=UPI003D336CFE